MARKRPGLGGALLRLAGAAALGYAARSRIRDADARARTLLATPRTDGLDRALPALTDLGSTYALGGAAAVLALFGKRTLARDVLGAGGLAWAVAQALKVVYRTDRPYEAEGAELLVRKPAGRSYPSGHPAVSMAVSRVLRAQVHAPATAVIERLPGLVAYSRVYVGAHYPSDVIGGLLLGRALGDLWVRYARR
ncbi:MAG TPA: phosphatase PAP2 family protein [Actinomycetota bacterium]